MNSESETQNSKVKNVPAAPLRDQNSSDGPPVPIEVGILTIGKPTLAMALASLLLQNPENIRIHIVDTAERPVIHHEDFSSAMRLAFDRGISCTYERRRERQRNFSTGRLALLEALTGPNICFMDDDVVLPSGSLRM